eukprot:5367891-Pleurochrysis_carterae.AAC.1
MGREGVPLRSDTVGGYVAAIRIYRSRKARREVVPGAAAARLPIALKGMRREDGPAGARRLSRAFRAVHFSRLAATGLTAAQRG